MVISCQIPVSIDNNYLFKKAFNEIVDIPSILDFNCKPLSDVSIIGFCSLYF